MFKYLFAFLLICCLLSCGGNASSEKDIEKYEATKVQLAKRETKFPVEFLTINSTNKRNLIGQTVVKGVIKNAATVTAYKKVRIKLLYYSQGQLVENHEEVYDDVILPNNQHVYKAKYFTPKNTDSVGVSIMSAEVVE
ncbi:MAG: hypothetical protein LH478_04830 [Chitinophagaceae bacterium]|nr:hypothetical protein [Chitinophagaceae bacterium]